MSLNLLNDAIDHSEDYSKGYYVGIVTNNEDPLGIGRVQAKSPGLYDPEQGPVPWIGPNKDSPWGFGKGEKGPYGVYGSPQVGSKIKIELQNGDPNYGLYSPLLTKPDANPAFSSPSTYGYQDPSGTTWKVDMVANTLVFTHSSGNTVTLDGNGNDIRVVKGNATVTIDGTLNITVVGNASFKTSGTATYEATTHNFIGNMVVNGTLGATQSITDSTGSGNTKTLADLRNNYVSHNHPVPGVQSGGDTVTSQGPQPPL